MLLGVRKPARYIGSEWNVSKKVFEQAAITFALCFPDMYEVGMSNLGIRILYSILNMIPDVEDIALTTNGTLVLAADIPQLITGSNPNGTPLISLGAGGGAINTAGYATTIPTTIAGSGRYCDTVLQNGSVGTTSVRK